jgi:hypothetical protein
MNTKEYIKRFMLNDRKTFMESYQEPFLQALKDELEERMIARQNTENGLDYRIFQTYIREMQTKFSSISAKVPGGIPKSVWGAYYAGYILALRAKYFPKEHAEIIARRELYMNNNKDL